jgi:hypothetical protein
MARGVFVRWFPLSACGEGGQGVRSIESVRVEPLTKRGSL